MSLKDIALSEYTLDTLDGIGQLRRQMLEEPVHICIERARYITEYMKSCDADKEMEEHPVLFRARAVANYLDHKKAVIPDNSLLAASMRQCAASGYA